MSKKLSGAANRKRKIEQLETDEKLKNSLAKFLRQDPSTISSNNEPANESASEILLQTGSSNFCSTDNADKPTQINVCNSNKETASGIGIHSSNLNEENVIDGLSRPDPSSINPESDNNVQIEIANNMQTNLVTDLSQLEHPIIHSNSENIGNTKLNINFSDPATWAHIELSIDQLRPILIEHGPVQVKNYIFPADDQKRKFSNVHYYQKLVNGERIHRDWVLYSISTNKVYCFCCLLFSKGNRLPSLATNGTKDWHNIAQILTDHQKSHEHKLNYNTWKDFEKRWKKGQSVDIKLIQQTREEEKYWSKVLERLIAIVKLLSFQNLAFQGTYEKLHVIGNGNFLKLVELLALFDPIMQEHVRKIKDEEMHVHYLGKNIQNELIQILADSTRQKILENFQKAKYFSIILDCTPDVSHVEQMTVIIRFVHVTPFEESEVEENLVSTASEDLNKPLVSIQEHFLGFIPLEAAASGSNMTDVLLNFLDKFKLPVDQLRGQSYDNGSNMAGKNAGVQRKILNINPRAFFVPCGAHTLNLVINDAATSCTEAATFFDLVQKVYVFFSPPRRWSILKKHLPNLTLKPLCATRWSSRIDAIIPLRYQLEEICDALLEISEDYSFTGTTGNFTRAEALSIANNITKYKFLIALTVWHKVLFHTNVCSKLLQSVNLNIIDAVKQLEETKIFLEKLRNDEEFEKILVDANEMAEKLGIEPVFQNERVIRRRTHFEYEGRDEPISNPKTGFKIKFYFVILDTAINSVKERFSQLGEISSPFGFLYNIAELKESTSEEILDLSKNLEKKLTGTDSSKDIDALELCMELRVLSQFLPPRLAPMKILEYLCQNRINNNYPNVFIALRILLTIPVNVASGERSFSKMKLIKTYIRNRMTQDRLSSLAILSIEQELVKTLPLQDLVSIFAKIKARKVKF